MADPLLVVLMESISVELGVFIAGSEVEIINENGCDIRTTPKMETRPAICWLRVNGVLITKDNTQAATMGAKNVMTVASAKGR